MRPLSLFCIALSLACGGEKAGPQPPAPPTGVSVQAGDGQATLIWDPSPGAIGYRAWIRMGTNLSHGEAGTATSFTFHALTNGTTYSFSVTAIGPGGESLQSTPVTATPQANVPLAVAAISPADGATAVPRGTAVTITFNRAAQNVTAGCSGTVRLSRDDFTTCVDGTFISSNGGSVWTFLPGALLDGNATWKLRVTTGVQDAHGLALQTELTSTGFTTDLAPSLGVTGVDLQHLFVSWSAPASADETCVYLAPAGGSYALYLQTSQKTGTATVGPLTPGKSWDVKFATITAGVETPANEVKGVTTGFAGTPAEWLAAQTKTGAKGGHFRFAWNDAEFFAAYSDAADAATLQDTNSDALWIAFDTDPDTDTAGEARTQTGGTGEIIWPFKADYIVELKSAGAKVRSAGAWADLPATTKFASNISEIRFARAAIGSPTKVRIALAGIGTATGYTFDTAPAPAAPHLPTFAQEASLTDAFSSLLDTGAPTVVPARALVHFNVGGATSAVQLKGSILPLTYATPLALSAGAGDVNLGGQTGELFFKFTDGGTDEFAQGKDRVFTLDGTAQSIPDLTWNTAYGATHDFTLFFSVTDAANPPTEIRGNVAELGNFGTSAGAAVTGAGPIYNTAAVLFHNHDFVSTPLEFKAWYGGSSTYEGANGSSNDMMNDDVINSRKLAWTACAGSTCPTF